MVGFGNRNVLFVGFEMFKFGFEVIFAWFKVNGAVIADAAIIKGDCGFVWGVFDHCGDFAAAINGESDAVNGENDEGCDGDEDENDLVFVEFVVFE